MSKRKRSNSWPARTAPKPKTRKLGGSNLSLVEDVPREIADAEIERLFGESKLFPDEQQRVIARARKARSTRRRLCALTHGG